MHATRLLSSFLILGAVGAAPGPAADDSPAASQESLQEQVEALRQEHEQIRRQLDQILARLDGAPREVPEDPSIGRTLDVGDAPSLGTAGATVTLVELADYQCPYCARHHRQTFPLLKERFVDPGTVRYVILDYPLDMHPQAEPAARAAHCAREQDAYWEMHHLLFERSGELAEIDLASLASELGLDAGTFRECLDAGRHAALVAAHLGLGQAAGVEGTPTFLLGATAPGSTVLTIESIIRGAHGFDRFAKEIDALVPKLPAPTGQPVSQ